MRRELTRPDKPAAPTAIAVLLGALLASVGHTTTYVIPADADLLAETPLVLYGVVEHSAVVDERTTDALVRVERVLKGAIPGSTVLVRQPGAHTTRLMGLRMLRPGDAVLLFLRQYAPGLYHTVDLGLGAFFEDRGHLDRHIGESGFRNTERFNDWIVDRVAGVDRAADYRVDSLPGPHRVTQAATWIRDWSCGREKGEANPYRPADGYRYDTTRGVCYNDEDANGLFEPYPERWHDDNDNGQWDDAETLTVDYNNNGEWDDEEEWYDNWPWGDGSNPGNGQYDPPEPWEDRNGSCYRDPGEPYSDLNGNGQHDEGDWLHDLDCNQTLTLADEYIDADGSGHWDEAERFYDSNGNGVHDGPESEVPCENEAAYHETNHTWNPNGEFYYEDRNGNGTFDTGDVKLAADDVVFRFIRWKNFDPGFTLYCGVDGCNPGYYERNFSIDVDPNQGSWLTPEQKVSAVNDAVKIWKSAGSRAFTGSTLADPLVNSRKGAFDHTDYWQSFISVEIGASQDRLGCGAITSRNLLNTSSAVGAAVDYTGAGEQLFVDDYGVAFYDEDGAMSHSSRNKYKCTDATWDRGNGTTVGNSTTLLVPGSTTETRASKCTAGTNDDGYYTPGNNPRPVMVPACDNSRVLGSALVGWSCNIDDDYTVHSIPGGTGKAYRLDSVHIRLGDNATTRDADGLKSVLAHELGHALGIGHSDAGGANIMNATISRSSPVTSLSADDRAAVRKLYPAGSSASDSPGGNGGGGPAGDSADPPPADEDSGFVARPVPPEAAFSVDVHCLDELCRIRTGDEIGFADTSSGTVASRSWDFETAGTAPRGKTVKHRWEAPGFYRATLTVGGAGVESTWSRMFQVEAADPAGSCVSGGEAACLQDSRYEVAVEWQHPDGSLHPGRLVHAGTNDSALFSFFDGDNWEVLVKVLNGCAINAHHWVYAASATDLGYVIRVTDTAAGESKEFRNEAGRTASAVVDPEAFSSLCEPREALSGSTLPSGGETLLIGDGRFEVGIEWSTADDRGLARTAYRQTDDSGLFWFFEPGNWEVLVKVLDGCGVNGHHWVYAASATSLPFELSVTDTVTGEVYHYSRSEGELGALADPAALSCAP